MACPLIAKDKAQLGRLAAQIFGFSGFLLYSRLISNAKRIPLLPVRLNAILINKRETALEPNPVQGLFFTCLIGK
ncbi:hypothetical protein B1222_11590 [Paenibacillus larvae subsp. pulvifaciens]|uniref:Uncharacterized protein n=1 Tax=Paenibacillus larvae subsp. pulvifaciens TaxID=1477 RepID=A0A1U9YN52_9BACL|nr:hypothetical protein BXP28_17690 [Paenibacillus larvae subsp. larvae]AQT84879.1 hypothetical protein B1222_11590 [Paenibacillus larvae subsp. pulvifaciens]AQZ46877.1 hypothetical protein B5S25_10025 [Paenibacillus larvae subsp. pulvifaciens]ARF68258.1 hypothetical protein B7C51_11225 [Paenibacillus larvae subsp. pulvifaciens]MBH0343083.1 hypothetical protein [Paenibacillus larvae]